MTSPIGVNVTVNNNMDHCCPRRIKLFCCCCKVDEDQEEKIQDVAHTALETKVDSEEEK